MSKDNQSDHKLDKTKILPPKKKSKKTPMIVTLVILLALVVGGVLLYVFWWSKPEKMLLDSFGKIATSEQLTLRGDLSSVAEDADLKVNFASLMHGKNQKTDVDLAFGFKENKKLNLKAEGIVSESGEIYVKSDDLKQPIETFADELIAAELGKMTPEERALGGAIIEASVKEFKEQLVAKLSEIEGKWIGIGLDGQSDDMKQVDKCSLEFIEKVQKDENFMNQLGDAYKNNQFLQPKDKKIADRNGGRGFEFDLGDSEVNSKYRDFQKDFEEIPLVKELSDCQEKNNNGAVGSRSAPNQPATGEGSDSVFEPGASSEQLDMKGQLTIWIDRLSHRMTAFEYEYEGQDKGEYTVKISSDLEYSADEVSVPNREEVVDIKDIDLDL